MNPFDRLMGNEKQKRYFMGEIAKGKLPHAFILEGEEGSGRHTLAYAVAAAMADPMEQEKIFKGQSPDVREYGLAPEKKVFTVETVRKMKSDAAIKPNDLPFKLFVLSNAECMNQQAQNAALKILEEPPENTYFFLLCESASALLPTVRSRASVIRMQRFSDEELTALLLKDEALLAKRKSDPAFFEQCVKSAGGSYGRAKVLLEGKDGSALKERAIAFVAALDPPDKTTLLLLAYKLPSNRQELDKVLFYMQQAVRDQVLLRSCKGGSGLFFYSQREAEELPLGLSVSELLRIYELITSVKRQVALNVNVQNARLALASGIIKTVG
ncbi:MAG: hypothetical protein J6M12_05465 [Clostridia bacterium]|nr:hypothetical protein [Clostridia bacterium]